MLFLAQAANPIADALNSSEWVFPIAEFFHIGGFAIAVGTITMVDLRLMGAGLRAETPAQLTKDTAPFTLWALTVVILAGMVLFLSDPIHYIHNGPFQFKMAILLLAILFNYTIHRKVALSGASPGLSKFVGALSIALWVSVVFGGLWIGFA